MTASRVHVQSVLNMIEAVSKVFFLSPLNSAAKSKHAVSYKNLTFWNVWTLVGFFSYMNCHLIYVSQNDNSGRHLKLVTVFIDMYNKYCGLLLSFTLVVTGYFQQANIAKINLLFGEIEDEFERGMKIKIKNLNALRWVDELWAWQQTLAWFWKGNQRTLNWNSELSVIFFQVLILFKNIWDGFKATVQKKPKNGLNSMKKVWIGLDENIFVRLENFTGNFNITKVLWIEIIANQQSLC